MSKEIGLKLKQERVNKKLTIDDVASKLKIRKFYIESMESGDFSELPGITYIIGFIRSYTKLLGIEADPLIAILRNESVPSKKHSVGLASPKMESALPSRSTIIISLSLLAVFYIIWAIANSDEEEKEITAITPPPVVIDKIEIQEINNTESQNIDGENSEVAPADQSIEQDSSVTEGEEATTTDNFVEKAPAIETVTIEELPYVNPEGNNYGTADKDTARIIIYAVEDSWVQLRNDEELLFSKVLLVGDRYFISNYTDAFVMDTGNAGGLVIAVDGKILPSLGEKGSIIRGFSLTEENMNNFAGFSNASAISE